MRYSSQNLTDGKLPMWRHGRAWWGPLAWEWSVFRRSTWGASIGIDRFSIRIGFASLYVNVRRSEDSWGREFQVRFHDGAIWISHPWVRKMEWRSSDPWWKKTIRLPVEDWILGSARCERTEGEPFHVYVPMPEGSYLATARHETFVWRRRFYVPERRRESVTLDIPGGIPHAGKGENGWDCGDDGLWGISGETTEKAIGNAVASVLKSRQRYGHDSSGAGIEPLVVLNTTPDKPSKGI